MKLLPFLLLCVAVGCATRPKIKSAIKFESDPPGARVFYGTGFNPSNAVAKSFIGTTPCSWEPPQNGGRFELDGMIGYSKFVPPAIVFEGRGTNGITQQVIFRGEAFGRDADKVPPGVFFDLLKR